MAKNRRNQSAGLRFGPALTALLLCLLFGGAGVGYVWQKDQIRRLGDQIQARERRLARALDENEQRRKQLADMRRPAFLENRIRELNLGLVQPAPWQVLRLMEPASAFTPAEPNFAVRGDYNGVER